MLWVIFRCDFNLVRWFYTIYTIMWTTEIKAYKKRKVVLYLLFWCLFKEHDGPYSFSPYWTGISLQWSVIRIPQDSLHCLSCKLVPVQPRKKGTNTNMVRLFTVPYFSARASETWESTKCPWVGVMEGTEDSRGLCARSMVGLRVRDLRLGYAFIIRLPHILWLVDLFHVILGDETTT